MKKITILLTIAILSSSCTMTHEQRQRWENFGAVVRPMATVAIAGASVVGAVAQHKNAKTYRRRVNNQNNRYAAPRRLPARSCTHTRLGNQIRSQCY